MDKINSHYDHLQDRLFIGSSAPTSSSSSSSAPNSTFIFSSPSEATSKENDSSSTTSYTANEAFHPMMAQNLGFHHQWADISNAPDNFPRTFTDMLIDGESPSSAPTVEDLYLCPLSSHTTVVTKNNDLSAELSQKLMLRTLSSSSRIEGGIHQFIIPREDEFHFSSSRGLGTNFSQIHPSINISSPTYQSSCTTSTSLDCANNWPAFDLLSNGRIRDTDLKTSGASDFRSLLRESLINPDSGLHQMKEASRRPETTSFERMSLFSPNTTEGKRPNSSINEPKAFQVAAKKTRIESRSSSCPPMKVRKEKLGDRIAALQQLVAPFGKTDTASVLMEAIGYIKFLQNQVQTLSVPYMKSSQNNSRTSERGSRNEVPHDNVELRRDLRSRGLCLVPLSCMSYITNDVVSSGNSIWSPQDFGGGI